MSVYVEGINEVGSGCSHPGCGSFIEGLPDDQVARKVAYETWHIEHDDPNCWRRICRETLPKSALDVGASSDWYETCVATVQRGPAVTLERAETIRVTGEVRSFLELPDGRAVLGMVDGRLLVWDRSASAEEALRELGSVKAGTICSLLQLDESRVVVGATCGEIHCLDLESGSSIWETEGISRGYIASLVLSHGVIAALDHVGRLAFISTDGDILAVHKAPWVGQNRTLLAHPDGGVVRSTSEKDSTGKAVSVLEHIRPEEGVVNRFVLGSDLWNLSALFQEDGSLVVRYKQPAGSHPRRSVIVRLNGAFQELPGSTIEVRSNLQFPTPLITGPQGELISGAASGYVTIVSEDKVVSRNVGGDGDVQDMTLLEGGWVSSSDREGSLSVWRLDDERRETVTSFPEKVGNRKINLFPLSDGSLISQAIGIWNDDSDYKARPSVWTVGSSW